MVCALVRGSTRGIRRGWYGQKPLIFMHFHGVPLRSQHAMWSKQHNGKVRILQSRRSRQKHQNQVFGTKSVQIFCREFGSRLLPLDSSVNLQGWAGSNTVLSICSQPVEQASARLADSIHWNDRCRATLAGMPVRVGRTNWPLTLIGHDCIIHI